MSYEELLNNAVTISKAFKELGIKQGDIITISMPNFSQAVASYLAANRIGATTTFLNPFASIEEIKGYLNLFESPLFINFDKDTEYNQSIKNDTKVRQIITLSKGDLNSKKFLDTSVTTIGYSDFLNFSEMGMIADYQKKPFKTLYGGKQDSLILFTSGATGNPKAVVLTNQNNLASRLYMKNSTHLLNTKGEKSLVCVPFTYPYGFATSTLMSLLCGREAILAPNLTDQNIGYFLSKNILMDDMMPGVSGTDTMKILKQELNCNIPIIVLTANATDTAKQNIYQMDLMNLLQNQWTEKLYLV